MALTPRSFAVPGGYVIADSTRDFVIPSSYMSVQDDPGPPPTGRTKVWTGSAWVLKPVKVWTGSAWVEKPLKVWNGSAWV